MHLKLHLCELEDDIRTIKKFSNFLLRQLRVKLQREKKKGNLYIALSVLSFRALT